MFARSVGTGIGAGLVSALLFAVVATGSAPGVLLSYVAPLPIIIAALGWGRLVGLLATAAGGLALCLFLNSAIGLAFSLGAALPAWCLCVLAGSGAPPAAPAPGRSLTLPLGHLLLAAALLASAMVVAGAVAVGGGEHDVYEGTLARFAEAFLRVYSNTARDAPLPDIGGVPAASFVSLVTAVTPAVIGSVLTVVLVANLWVGGRIVAVSGRLPGSWVPTWRARMPVSTAGLLLLAFALCFGSGFVGLAGRGLAGAVLTALALQGFALLHAVTRGRSSRGLVLGFAYTLAVVASGPFLPLMIAAGLADVVLPIRRHLARAAIPPGPNGPSSPSNS